MTNDGSDDELESYVLYLTLPDFDISLWNIVIFKYFLKFWEWNLNEIRVLMNFKI